MAELRRLRAVEAYTGPEEAAGGPGPKQTIPTALKAKINIKSASTPGSGPESAQNPRCLQENGNPDPPPNLSGGGEVRTK